MLNYTFKIFGGEEIPDLSKYVRDYVQANPTARIYVGCDSDPKGKNTLFAMVIAFRYENNGAHIIFARESVPKIRDMFTRLWREVEQVLLIGEKELEGLYNRINREEKLVDLHVDINSDPAESSHVAYAAALGYLKGYGFRASGKPNSWAATSCSDLLVKNTSKKKRRKCKL